MWTLMWMLIAALGFPELAPPAAEPEGAPVRVDVALLPGSVAARGELVTVEVAIGEAPADQSVEVTVALVDLVLPDGQVLAMEPTPADPGLWTAHVVVDGVLQPGLHHLVVIVLDTEGRERVVRVPLEVVSDRLDVASGW
jgi:hypothetical protein